MRAPQPIGHEPLSNVITFDVPVHGQCLRARLKERPQTLSMGMWTCEQYRQTGYVDVYQTCIVANVVSLWL